MTIEEFAAKVQEGKEKRLIADKLDCSANMEHAKTHIHNGSKYDRVDNGTSGLFMVNKTTHTIHGIKAYGVPNLLPRHYWGTLENPSPACFEGRYGY